MAVSSSSAFCTSISSPQVDGEGGSCSSRSRRVSFLLFPLLIIYHLFFHSSYIVFSSSSSANVSPLSPSSSDSSSPHFPVGSSVHVPSFLQSFYQTFFPSTFQHITYTDDGSFNRRRYSALPPCYPNTSSINLEEIFPLLRPFYSKHETNFRAGLAMSYNRTYYWAGLFIVILYLLFVKFGPIYMDSRKPYDLRTPLKYWNLSLAIFSLVGTIRLVPHLIYVIYTYGFAISICSPPVYTYGQGSAGLWLLLFTYSKYFELVDTVFIVLRKRPLGFLHWYHHCTVLLYTWDGYCTEQPAGVYFVCMNFAVHSVMYLYYYLAAELKRPLSWGVFVTVAQISQMVGGVFVTVASLYYVLSYDVKDNWVEEQVWKPLEYGVYISFWNLVWAMLMYSTYFYLFAKFFAQRYCIRSKSGGGNKTGVLDKNGEGKKKLECPKESVANEEEVISRLRRKSQNSSGESSEAQMMRSRGGRGGGEEFVRERLSGGS